MTATPDLNAERLFFADAPFGTALYLGPGLGDIALALSGAHASRLIAFSDVTTHRLLGAQKTDPQLDVFNHLAVVSPSGEEHALHGYNVQGLASVRAATGLKELFPGLQEKPRISVETRALQTALQDADLTGENNLLILGANGCEMDILNAVLAAEAPPRFARIILMLPGTALYAGASDGQTLYTRLEEASYRRVWTDASDPDIPIAAFDLDETRLADRTALAERDKEIGLLNDSLERLTSDLAEAEERSAALEAALDSAKLEKDSALQELAEAQASEDIQADLSIALRLQELREADLTDMRQRYQTLKSENEHLGALIRRIHHSLASLQTGKRSAKKTSKQP